MSVWNPNQTKVFERALAAAESWEQKIAVLLQMAKYAPQFAERIRELAARTENVKMLSTVALSMKQ
jgi:sulfur transfer protein SufE